MISEGGEQQMLAKRIIPCLDVNMGRVVKGINFVGLKDVGDPVEIAKFYDKEGADELVFLDITASHEGRKTMIDVVSKTAEQVFIPLTVGGGISTLDDIRDILRAGADKISINSAAVKNPRLVAEGAEHFGSQCIVVAADAKRREDRTGWNIFINGGRIDTGLDAIEYIKKVESLGAGEILLTSMDADGTKEGFDIDLCNEVCSKVNIPVIASGGCGSKEHIKDVFNKTAVDAALAASIFHYKEANIDEVKKYLRENGVRVRI